MGTRARRYESSPNDQVEAVMTKSTTATPHVRTAPDDKLSTADTILRFVLSGLIIFLFVLSARLLVLSGSWSLGSGYVSPRKANMAARPVVDQERRFDRSDLPLPMYPGAKGVDGVQMDFNGSDFIRCEFTAAASKKDIMGYYRRWLRRQGWRDWVEDTFRPEHSKLGQMSGLPIGLENEEHLRYYDQLQREQLNFARGEERVAIYVKRDEGHSHRNRVALQYFEKGSPDAIRRNSQKGNTGGGKKPLMTFEQELGGDLMQTSFVQDRRPPATCLKSLVARFHRQGWRDLAMPKGAQVSLPDNFAQMIRDRDMMYVRVEADTSAGGSVATITTMSSGRQ